MPLASELVQACTTVFTLPEVYFCVRDAVDNPESTLGDLAEAFQLDPMLSARLLRSANNGGLRQIDTLTDAIQLLNRQTVNELIATTTVGRAFSGMPTHLMDVSKFWRKSVLCALLAGNIAKSCGINGTERFVTAGLLRDMGHFVLYQTVPQRAQSALIEAGYLEASLAEVEQSNIGCDFAEVGAEFIRSWGMPVQIEQAVRCQLSPKDAGEFILQASIVHLAGVAADYDELEPSRRPATMPFSLHAVTATGFMPAHLPSLLTDARSRLQDILALVHPYTMAA